MSADELRRAAETLRERANAATDGPWEESDHFLRDEGRAYVIPAGDPKRYVCAGGAPDLDNDAAYIATMHPGVGLALADWLEAVAITWVWDENPDDVETPDGWPLTLGESTDTFPLKIARLINGGA